MSPGMSQGVETLRGQDSEMFGAGEEPSVADSMTRSVSLTSRLSVAVPLPAAVATHRSDVLGSALEASRTVQPFSSVLGALVGDAPPEALGADDAGTASSPHLVVTSVADRLVQLSRPVTDT